MVWNSLPIGALTDRRTARAAWICSATGLPRHAARRKKRSRIVDKTENQSVKDNTAKVAKDAQSMSDTASKAASSAARKAGAEAQDASAELAEQFAALKADLSALSASVAKLAGKQAESAWDLTEAAGNRIAQSANARIESVQRSAQDYGEQVETYTRDNPAKALGIAAGVGFLTAMLLARR